MPKQSEYDTKVKPHLDKIRQWVTDFSEGQIAVKLGITQQTFIKYKKEHPELSEAILDGIQDLKDELKDTLKRKAKGFKYVETKIIEDEKNGKRIETYEKYAQPDVGAIHLLLKNIDPEWHNDDAPTLDINRKQQEIERERLEMQKW